MDRPSRKTKAVNYCESKDFDEDDDFACVKAPSSKKAKETFNQQDNKKVSTRLEIMSESPQSQKSSRKPLDVKLYERDLEAAISLSMLNSTDATSNQSPIVKENAKVLSSVDENQEPPSLCLSNCIVDSTHLGLDQITADFTAPSKQKKELADVQRIKSKNEDEDYQPIVALDSESDKDYSELESDDEEFTVKKSSKAKKEKVVSKRKPPQSAKKEKQPRKTKSTGTPLTTKNTSEPTRPTSSKVSKPTACLSPTLSKIPKWTPPGQIGKSPSSSNSPIARSPGQGLRLGLSRLVRVKPLHPSVTSH